MKRRHAHFVFSFTYTLRNLASVFMVNWPTRSPFHFSFTRFQAGILRKRYVRAGLVRRQIEVPNGSVSCWVGGTGAPLLMLHGFGASAIWQFHSQVKVLARNHWIVIPDLLYFGGSTSPNGERSIAYQAETMFQVMDSLEISSFGVLGLSYGGFVALWMGSQRPSRVGRMIISDSPGFGMTAHDYQVLLDTFDVAHPRDVFLPTQPSGVRTLMKIAWYRAPPLPGFALRDAYRNLFHNQVVEKRELLDELVSHLEQSDIDASGYDAILGPVLIIWGAHDRVFPVHLGRRMHRAMGVKSRLEILSKTAHAPNLERPRVFNRLVHRFLAE